MSVGLQRLGYLAVAAVAIMVTAALGNSSASAEPGVSKDTIRIGLFGPLTGQQASIRPVLDGVIAYYQSINAEGGINGRKLELVTEDDACEVTKARSAVKKLLYQGDVFALH